MLSSTPTDYYLILDSGTSSSKVFAISSTGKIEFTKRIKHELLRPAPFHVECDANETFIACNSLLQSAVKFVKRNHGHILRCGFTVQRSTFLFWDKETKEPLTPALNWQDSRANDIVNNLQEYAEQVRAITGTPLSAHFGGPKYQYLVEQDSELKQKVDSGKAWFGPLSAYLTHKFSDIACVDESIAGRSILMDIDSVSWSNELMTLFHVNPDSLPPLATTVGEFGILAIDGISFPLSCVIGDQQAALIGQGGITPNSLAMNFGTSGSVQFNSGQTPLHIPELLSSVLTSDNKSRYYLLEGTINACNSLFYWLEEELGIPHNKMMWNERSEHQTTKGVLIPGFIGLAAPYWTDQFDTVQYKLNTSNDNEIVRAGMESIGFLVYDIIQSMKESLTNDNSMITASGGGSRSSLLQFIADLLQRPIGHSAVKDRTAMGVFQLLYHLDHAETDISASHCDVVFNPEMNSDLRAEKIGNWQDALTVAGINLNN